MNKNRGVALVTGAGKRLGRAIAIGLADAGFDVAVHYRTSATEAKRTVEEIRARGRKALAFRADLRSAPQIQALAGAVRKRLGPVRVLVNSAATFEKRDFLKVTQKNWDEAMNTNLRPVFFLSQVLGGKMAAGSVIINLEDAGVNRLRRGYAPYLVSKAGVAMLTRVLALELAPQVRVCGIAPGPVLMPESYDPALKRKIIAQSLLKREGGAKAVADAAVWLATTADYITGATLVIDGGITV